MIYCKNCRYLNLYTGAMGECSYYCHTPKNIITKHNAITEWRTEKDMPEGLNYDNNCSWYKPIWYKFWITKGK